MELDTRKLPLEGAHNFRDIGGLVTKDGRWVKKGLLYRSDDLHDLTGTDIRMLQELGLKTVIDYRNEHEWKDRPDVEIPGVTVCHMDPKADAAAMASSDEVPKLDHTHREKITAEGLKALMTEQNRQFVLAPDSKRVYRTMLEMILKEENLPLDQHCRGGKDRTGYGAALILLLLGVDRETVVQDYLLTNVCKKEKNEKSLKKMWEATHDEDLIQAMRYAKEANESFLLAALDLIDTNFGGIEQYTAKELELPPDYIPSLREMFLE